MRVSHTKRVGENKRVLQLKQFVEVRLTGLKGIWHPSAHVQQFDFSSDGRVFKVDNCVRNPYPSTLLGVWK